MLQQAYAATYLIDFGVPTNETTSVDVNGNLWNNLSRNNDPNDDSAPKNQRTGDITLVSTLGEAGFIMNYNYPTAPNRNFTGMNGFTQSSGSLANLGLLNVDSAKNDGIWSQGPVSLVFTGLDPDMLYTFSLFAHRVNEQPRTSVYQLIGETTSEAITYAVATSKDDGGRLVIFENYKPDATGKIELLMTAGTGGYTYLNAL